MTEAKSEATNTNTNTKPVSMSKAEMLSRMAELKACSEATEFVSRSELGTCREIGLSCDNVDWLIWFVFRIRPDLASGFAHACADRTGSESARYWASAARAAAAAWYASTYAAWYATVYADTYVAERKVQLIDLHRIWGEVFT